jgi:hypothetical protein
MPVQFWESLVNVPAPWQTNSGTTLNSGTSETVISPSSPDFTFPANYWYPGLVMRLTARGIFTVGSTATNFTFTLRAGTSGSLTSGTSLATTGALAATTSLTNQYWEAGAVIQCRATGSSGNTFYTHGQVRIQTSATAEQVWPMPATNGPTAAAVDTTAAKAIGLTATLSQNTGTPAITCTQFLIEICN